MANPKWVKGMKCPGVPIQDQIKKRKAVRTHLQRAFITDFALSWEKDGKAALDRLAKENPGAYVKAAASLMPKLVNKHVTSVKEVHQLTTEQLMARLEKLRAEKNDGIH